MRTALVVIAAFMAWIPPTGAESPDPPTTDWRSYRMGQFISSRGRMPSDVAALDNNREILLACRDGCSLESLASAGVDAIPSQLELLRTWSLLTVAADGYRTAIPILHSALARELGERADAAAEKVVAAIGDEVAALVGALASEGRQASAWTVVFAYVLDGLVWEFFAEEGRVAPRNVSRGGAPWGGEVWLHLAGDRPGTSSLERGSLTLKTSWIEPLRPHVVTLMGSPDGAVALLGQRAGEGPEVTAHLRAYGIVDADGRIRVPVVRTGVDDPIAELCERMTEEVVSTVLDRLSLGALVADFGFESESQALVVAYHEVMWRAIDRLALGGHLATPVAIADPSTARPVDIGELVVLVQHAAPAEAAGGASPRRDQE